MRGPLIILYALFVSVIVKAQSISIEPVGTRSEDVLYAGQTNLLVIRDLPKGAKVNFSPSHYFENLRKDTISITPQYCSTPRKEKLTMVVSKGLDILEKKVFFLDYNGAMLAIDSMICIDTVSKSYLLQHGFRIIPGNLNFEIISFTISFIPKRGEVIGPLPSDGGRFSAAQKDLIQRLKNGDAIYVEDIKAECGQCGYPPFFRKQTRIVLE